MIQNNEYTNELLVERPVNGHKVYNVHAASKAKSEEVQDIISKMPNWLIRRGTSLLLLIILLLFSGAYFIRYPDVIITNVNISSVNPPVKIMAQSSGKIQRLFVKSNQQVTPGESICLLENPSSFSDMIMFKNLLYRLDTTTNLNRELKNISLNHSVQLGELQAGYVELYQSITQYLFFTTKNFTSAKLEQLKSQVAYQSQLDIELQNKDKLLTEQLNLERKKFQADSTLVKEKVIAPLEFDNSKKELINRQMNADATKTSMLQNKLQQTEYLKVMTDLQQQKLQQENDLQQKIKETVKKLIGLIVQWEQKYLIKSPTGGNAVFFKFWKENQFVNEGEAVLMIVPPVQTYTVKSSLPLNGAGKVKEGQRVLIKLSAYPYEEFGLIKGVVKTISNVALDTAYSMEIQLTNGLTTTVKRKVPPQPLLPGTAEVITNDRSLLERLFEKLWARNHY